MNINYGVPRCLTISLNLYRVATDCVSKFVEAELKGNKFEEVGFIP